MGLMQVDELVRVQIRSDRPGQALAAILTAPTSASVRLVDNVSRSAVQKGPFFSRSDVVEATARGDHDALRDILRVCRREPKLPSKSPNEREMTAHEPLELGSARRFPSADGLRRAGWMVVGSDDHA
jgi:hypothetical protein